MHRNPASNYDAELAVAVDMSLSLAQSGQMISSPSVMKPLPAMESWHIAHIKHWECQWRPSNEIKRVPPAPVMGLLQAVHRLANSSPKQLALEEKKIMLNSVKDRVGGWENPSKGDGLNNYV